GEVDLIDPVAMRVEVGGKTIEADYMVVSLGARLAPELVPGLEEAGHNLYSMEGSIAVRDFGRELGRETKGMKLVVLVAGMPFKCPAAPYEAAMLLAHHAQHRHPQAGASISLYSPESGPMGVAGPMVSAGVKGMVAQCGVDYYPKHQVEKVDPASHTLFFDNGVEASYDFLAYVPPHVVPEVVCRSGLAEVGGWIVVGRESMETRFPGVFAIGDNTSIPLEMGLPLPKAGVFAHRQAQAVAKTIVARVNGMGREGAFDGHGQCFVEVGGGRAGFGGGDFYALPVPKVKLHEPSRKWHMAKVLFEKRWMKRWF
ncbi:MAG: FAD/NAD(P)-binding oxidoreductase, partial [Dehalococcoidia bacterium]